MKKIVAFSVLFALLSAAVFAQDSSGWKIGFSAGLARDFFYATKQTSESTTSTTGSPDVTTTLGDYIKGSSNVFTRTEAGRRPDNRLLLSLSNNGDHHSVYIDMKVDDTWTNGVKFYDILTADSADWWFSGDTGASGGALVLDAKVGAGRYGGFVPAYEFWDDYLDLGGHNFFGVYQNDGFRTSNNISGANMSPNNPWGTVYALGATFGGNFRFALGSTLGSFSTGYDDPTGSKSSIESAFMLSGKNLGPLTFDVFYAVKGKDENTGSRGDGTTTTGYWDNTLGFYAGIDVVKGLGLSVGYTAAFRKFETAQVLKDPLDDTKGFWVYEVQNPFYSGIDIKVKFTGVDKLSVTFNNNISFAAVEGAKAEKDDTRIMGISGSILGEDQKEGGFVYDVILGVSYSITPSLSATFALGNNMKVFTTESKSTSYGTTTETNNMTIADEFRISVHADYNVGNITFGIGLNLGVEGTTDDNETKSTWTGGSSTTTYKSTDNTVRFSVPLFFKVSI